MLRSKVAKAAGLTVIALFAAYAAGSIFGVRPRFMRWPNDLMTIIVPALAAMIIATSAQRAKEAKATWWLFAAGAMSWAIGDTIFVVLEHIGYKPSTTLTWADAFYLGLVPLWGAALVFHPRRSARSLERAGGTLDMVAVLIAAGGIAWGFVIEPLAHGNHGLSSVIAAVIYPLGDLTLLTAFGALIIRSRMNMQRSDIFIGAGALMFALADLTYARLALHNAYTVGSVVDLMFEAGFILVAFASFFARRPNDKESMKDAPLGAFTGALAIAALIAVVSFALVTHRPVISGAAMVMGVLIAVRQTLILADRRKLMQAVEDARAVAERANKAKTEFLSHMSHELGTPLSSVLGYAELLKELIDNDDVKEYAKRIENAGNHLHDIVREALDISRIEQGRLGMSLEPIAVSDLVDECIDVVRPIAESAGITLTINVDAHPDLSVLADRQRLKQILINLLSNAIKYNHDAGSVTLSWNPAPDGTVRLNVTDTGPGIAKDAQSRLFTPFERLGVGKDKVKGTGLGLALAKRMTEAMGGKIGITSEVGVGSTFWVELPHAPAMPKARTDDLAQLRRVDDSEQRTILYIEDNISNVKLVEEVLRGRNVKVIASMQGSVGVDLAREHRPDVVLLDRHLPDTSAEVVLAQLRATPQTAHIPVIVVSAEPADGDYEPLMAAGARAYLTKPLDVNRFVRIIDDVFASNAAVA